jgi:hypothetical protein
MKKLGVIMIMGFSILFAKAGFSQTANDAVYLETISTPDKSMDFIAGVYPNTYYYNVSGDYSTLTLKVLNNSSTSLGWNDYKVYILLKDGTLFYNYKTKAESGEYSCVYTVPTGTANSQSVAFSGKFDIHDISSVYLSFSDSKFFNLLYGPAKQANYDRADH